jgi:uncharacterized protein (TIGR02599 family)
MKYLPGSHSLSGFTLLEALVAMAVLGLIMSILLEIISQTSMTLIQATAAVESFQSARAAFDIVNQTLSQATLNTYWDYDNESNPTTYVRKSDLNFYVQNDASFYAQNARGTEPGIYFQAPLARAANQSDEVSGILNACGFYIGYGSNESFKPTNIVLQSNRFRLMEALQPTENFNVYLAAGNSWIASVQATALPIADNIIALVAWPRLSEGQDPAGTAISTDFSYNSRVTSGVQSMQLPPVVQLTMIAVDEASASRQPNLQSTINNVMNGKFAAVANYNSDLSGVESALSAAKFNYQVFTSAVPLRESQWSK